MQSRPLAPLDRSVASRNEETVVGQRLSRFRDEAAFILLGEPGSGKSSAFEEEARRAGTRVVTARDFVDGDWPDSRIVFIDALEEYRIAQPAADRLAMLATNLKDANYAQWRIACRAISLPRHDAERLEKLIGSFVTLQLQPLDRGEQRAILDVIGEAKPWEFIHRMVQMGADALLANPSTLLLLHETAAGSTAPLRTRGALLEEAVRQMALAPDKWPDDSSRPPAAQIVAAAEWAAIILLLSDRSDIWMRSSKPPGDHVVTRDDLLAAGIDTQALLAALDTPFFSGDGVGFVPSHRFVAEYLAGRSLAHATIGDAERPALSLTQAIAFLNGDDDRPAPALTGIFAWFVITLAGTAFASKALDLVRREPAAILFHGDAAMMPTEHRRVLLQAIGRDDPWFLRANQGSTGIAGLAGSDLAVELGAILDDPAESDHRRGLVMMALAAGRPVPELAARIEAIFAGVTGAGFYDRRMAGEAYARLLGGTEDPYKTLLDRLAGQTSLDALQLRIELVARLVPNIAVADLADLLVAYGRTGSGVIGYASALKLSLVEHPMPALFDAPIEVKRHTGQSRFHEVASVIDNALGAAIARTPDLAADRLLTWLANAGIELHDRPEDSVINGIGQWLGEDPGREETLLDALAGRFKSPWEAVVHFGLITGGNVSDNLAGLLIGRIGSAASDEEARLAGELVLYAIRPYPERAAHYWQLLAALSGRPALAGVLEEATTCRLQPWHLDDERERRRKGSIIDRKAKDRDWYQSNLAAVRSGGPSGHSYAADIYLGYGTDDSRSEPGPQKLKDWIGEDAFEAVVQGWQVLVGRAGVTAYDVGLQTTETSISKMTLVEVCWADRLVQNNQPLHASAAVLLRIAAYAFVLPGDRELAVIRAALQAFLTKGTAAVQLLAFWKGAIAGGSRDLPLARRLPPDPAVSLALETLLRERPALKCNLLFDAVHRAAERLPAADLLDVARAATGKTLPVYARKLWGFTAWILDPLAEAGLLAREFSREKDQERLPALWQGTIGDLAKSDSVNGLARLEAIVLHLGPSHPPRNAHNIGSWECPDLVSHAITMIGQSASSSAGALLERLIGEPSLVHWREGLIHTKAQQAVLRRQAEFTPPTPQAIAQALRAGPPATPGDLRAVVVECLEELAHDIRHGATSPWKGFWNRPSKGEATPKIENDCRDLLVDRLADRLRRFQIPVNYAATEARSGNDRRADVLVTSASPILAGQRAAALPIEAKRHWNDELWTAVVNQLVPYCRSAGSNGHGVYLIFWFGNCRKMPALPDGADRPTTAEGLADALRARLKPNLADSITIVVVDVSDPKIG